MSKLIIALLVACALLAICVYVIFKLIKKNIELKASNKKVKEVYTSIIKEYKENEKRKESLHTGDDVTDFNNSVELLQKLSSRNKS